MGLWGYGVMGLWDGVLRGYTGSWGYGVIRVMGLRGDRVTG